MVRILVKFLGEWAVWREYPTRAEAEDGLRFWRERMSHPLAIDGEECSCRSGS
jgi:hypothetical protein